MKKKVIKLNHSDRVKVYENIVSNYSSISVLLDSIENIPQCSLWLSKLLDINEDKFHQLCISDKVTQREILKENGCDNIFKCLDEINEYFPILRPELRSYRNFEPFIKDRFIKLRNILQEQRISP